MVVLNSCFFWGGVQLFAKKGSVQGATHVAKNFAKKTTKKAAAKTVGLSKVAGAIQPPSETTKGVRNTLEEATQSTPQQAQKGGLLDAIQTLSKGQRQTSGTQTLPQPLRERLLNKDGVSRIGKREPLNISSSHLAKDKVTDSSIIPLLESQPKALLGTGAAETPKKAKVGAKAGLKKVASKAGKEVLEGAIKRGEKEIIESAAKKTTLR